MTRLSGWTVAGLLAAMLVATIHTLVVLVLEQRRAYRLLPLGWPQP